MNIANRLTVLRILLAFVFIILLFSSFKLSYLAALFIFSLAALTDFLDGYIAKTRNMVTDLGKLLDPIADKILVLSAFISFVDLNIIPAWMVIIILFRELIVTGFRMLYIKRRVISATMSGKNKTFLQIFSIFLILIYLTINQINLNYLHIEYLKNLLNAYAIKTIYITVFITVCLTLFSGLSVLIKNRFLFKER